MLRRRPLRSVLLGNPRYLSAYALGVGQAMGLLGHWHRNVSVFDDAGSIEKQIEEMAPDVIWTHTTLWPPPGAVAGDRDPAGTLAAILGRWKRKGTAVYLHDGDPKEARTVEVDVASAYSIALVNRAVEGAGGWTIPSIRWPYAAMVQKEIGQPRSEWACDLLFAGHVRIDEVYGPRTSLVFRLHQLLGARMRIVSPGGGDTNNRMLVADVAPSAGAVLGFGRPEVPGWIDTRVFQYAGAGGVLIHDDAGGFLWPGEHYLQVPRGDIEAIIRAVERAQVDGPALRERAFSHVQAQHTWVHRVDTALQAYFGVHG